MGHMGLHDGHGEIGAQHHLAAQGIGGDIGAGADVFAVKVQQGFGGLQDIGIHRHGPCGAEGGEQGFSLGPDGGFGGHAVTVLPEDRPAKVQWTFAAVRLPARPRGGKGDAAGRAFGARGAPDRAGAFTRPPRGGRGAARAGAARAGQAEPSHGARSDGCARGARGGDHTPDISKAGGHRRLRRDRVGRSCPCR